FIQRADVVEQKLDLVLVAIRPEQSQASLIDFEGASIISSAFVVHPEVGQDSGDLLRRLLFLLINGKDTKMVRKRFIVLPLQVINETDVIQSSGDQQLRANRLGNPESFSEVT